MVNKYSGKPSNKDYEKVLKVSDYVESPINVIYNSQAPNGMGGGCGSQGCSGCQQCSSQASSNCNSCAISNVVTNTKGLEDKFKKKK